MYGFLKFFLSKRMLMSAIAKIISKLTTNSIQFHCKVLILGLK